MTEAKRSSIAIRAPLDMDHEVGHLREIFGGSEIVQTLASEKGVVCQQSIDLRR